MENKAEQYYPTYTFDPQNRDVVLAEFEEAQKIANTQTKVYGQVANVLIVVITILVPLFFNQNKEDAQTNLTIIQENALLFSLIVIAFGGILLRYFVELQQQITINARKVVTLRTILGLDYGKIHLTLPSWRVEGATNPFIIKYFNGWFQFQSIPFWVLTIGINVIWGLSTNNREIISIPHLPFKISWYCGNIILTLWYLFIFRQNLNDTHETAYLNFIKGIAYMLRIKLVENIEYSIYRTTLSHIELGRLKVDYEPMKNILLEIEDKTFYTKIVSFKSLLRGLLSQFSFIRKKFKWVKSGGSTITMQLARSSFISSVSQRKKWRRKIIEILLSFWLRKQFSRSKEDILKLYIASVRYEKDVLGLADAIKYFFGNEIKERKLTNEECFFLVERLSNVTSTVRNERIAHLLTRTKANIDKNKLDNIYNRLKKEEKLK